MDWRIHRRNLLNRKRTIEATPKPKFISFLVPITKNRSEYCLGNWDACKYKSVDETKQASQSEKETVAELSTTNDKEISVQTDFSQIGKCGGQPSEDVSSYKIKGKFFDFISFHTQTKMISN